MDRDVMTAPPTRLERAGGCVDAGFRVQGQTFGVRESRWSQQCRDKMARVSPVSEFTPPELFVPVCITIENLSSLHGLFAVPRLR